MKLKEILENIKEDFEVGYEDRYGEYREIFKNPSWKEILDITDGDINFRFVADKSRENIYVAEVSVLHEDIQEEVGGFKEHYFDLFSGVAVREGRREIRVYLDNLNCNIEDEIIEGEYDWVKKYYFKLRPLKIEILEDQEIPKEEWKYVLDEKWDRTVRAKSGKHIDVFKNPSRSDIKDALGDEIGGGYGEIRFVADRDYKDVYIWNANTSLFHIDVINDLNLGYVYKGIAEYNAGDLEVRIGESNVEEDDRLLLDILNGEYDWLDKYNFDLSVVKDYAEEEEEYLEV